MTSITGEKLHLNHVQAAVREAERLTGVEIWQFRLIPDVDAWRYDLLVEPSGRPASTTIGAEAFARAVDEALGRVNVEYAAEAAVPPARRRRASCVMRAGWAERQCRSEFARGRREGQHKWRAIQPEWDPDEPHRGGADLGGEDGMTRETARRAGQALLLWGGRRRAHPAVVAGGARSARALGRRRPRRAGERAPAVLSTAGCRAGARRPRHLPPDPAHRLRDPGRRAGRARPAPARAAAVRRARRGARSWPWWPASRSGRGPSRRSAAGSRCGSASTPAQRLVQDGAVPADAPSELRGRAPRLRRERASCSTRGWRRSSARVALYAAFRRRIAHEERVLAAGLPGYAAYMARTGALVPASRPVC